MSGSNTQRVTRTKRGHKKKLEIVEPQQERKGTQRLVPERTIGERLAEFELEVEETLKQMNHDFDRMKRSVDCLAMARVREVAAQILSVMKGCATTPQPTRGQVQRLATAEPAKMQQLYECCVPRNERKRVRKAAFFKACDSLVDKRQNQICHSFSLAQLDEQVSEVRTLLNSAVRLSEPAAARIIDQYSRDRQSFTLVRSSSSRRAVI